MINIFKSSRIFSNNCLWSFIEGSYKHNVRRISVKQGNLRIPQGYEGDGKTSVNILNNELDLGLMINGISCVGFRLNNDITILGPMVIFPRCVLSWNVESINDVTPESLSLFTILEPRLDIIVLGVGDRLADFSKYNKLLPFMRKHKVNLELLPTEQACATFNFLNSEGRYVAGALLPPQSLQTTEDDLLRSKLRYQNLYEVND